MRRIAPAIHPEAEVEIFNLGKFTGPEGWAQGMEEWLQTFQGLTLQVGEFINPPGERVVLVMGVSGRPGQSAAALAATSRSF